MSLNKLTDTKVKKEWMKIYCAELKADILAISGDIQTDEIKGASTVPMKIGASVSTSVQLGAVSADVIVQGDQRTSGKMYYSNGTSVNYRAIYISNTNGTGLTYGLRTSTFDNCFYVDVLNGAAQDGSAVGNYRFCNSTGGFFCQRAGATVLCQGILPFVNGSFNLCTNNTTALIIGAPLMPISITGNLIYAQAGIQVYGGTLGVPMAFITSMILTNTAYQLNFGTSILNSFGVDFTCSTAGLITYIGAPTRTVEINFNLSVSDSKAAADKFYVRKGAVQIPGSIVELDPTAVVSCCTISTMCQMVTGDTLSLWGETNNANNDITVRYLNGTIRSTLN